MSDRFAATALPQNTRLVDRRKFLPSVAAGRRVLHLGCVDEGLTTERSGTGALLHEELAKVATELTGVDLSRDGLHDLEAIVPGTYIHGNVEELSTLDLPSCDLVIAAELIEHLGNPARFYEGLHTYLSATGASAILTTPNAHGWVNQARFALLRSELVHPDHVLVYSPTTLHRALSAANLEPVEWWSHGWSRGERSVGQFLRRCVDRLVLGWNPWLGPGLIVRVEARPIQT